ncbi:unnamed protein product [Sphenostylis stenocarpa]|uniref:Uncharacterized protein n=1 Tax=Sphenostylis stenocarpa TaxID=92480 RepID=A0AA86SPL2_9FABA|nr:unnamed protein product [Sphenostylis stenocarpa]
MLDVEIDHATRIIDALAFTDQQAQHDRHSIQRKGVLELNSSDAILAQNKLITQQIEALNQKIEKLPQQMHTVQSILNQHMSCDVCGGDHANEQCSYQGNIQQEEANYMGAQGSSQGRQGNFPNPNNYQNNVHY